jgi:hypothetical protein
MQRQLAPGQFDVELTLHEEGALRMKATCHRSNNKTGKKLPLKSHHTSKIQLHFDKASPMVS